MVAIAIPRNGNGNVTSYNLLKYSARGWVAVAILVMLVASYLAKLYAIFTFWNLL